MDHNDQSQRESSIEDEREDEHMGSQSGSRRMDRETDPHSTGEEADSHRSREEADSHRAREHAHTETAPTHQRHGQTEQSEAADQYGETAQELMQMPLMGFLQFQTDLTDFLSYELEQAMAIQHHNLQLTQDLYEGFFKIATEEMQAPSPPEPGQQKRAMTDGPDVKRNFKTKNDGPRINRSGSISPIEEAAAEAKAAAERMAKTEQLPGSAEDDDESETEGTVSPTNPE